MSGGLEIRFFGRESRKRGVADERLRVPCDSLVEPVIRAMVGHPETLELNAGNSGDPGDRAMAALEEALRVVALEHKHCGWGTNGYENCPVPDISELPASRAYEALLSDWGSSTEVFMDTLCAHLQLRDRTDMSPLYTRRGEIPEWVAEGWADNRKRTAKLVEVLDGVLAPQGFRVTASGEVLLAEHVGTGSEIEGPSLDALDRVGWTNVAEKMREAVREIDEGNYGDAVTDVGTGLQQAFTRAGFGGKTLGEQIKAARAKPNSPGGEPAPLSVRLFGGVHTKLGDATDNLSEWVAAVRNIRSDAHDGPEATRIEADLALRTGLALAVWLADNVSYKGSKPGPQAGAS